MHHTHNFYLRVSRGLALLLMLTLGLGLIQSAQAQNVAPGYVIGWGWNHVGELNIPPGLSDVVAVSASQVHSLALRSNGEVVAWGCDGRADWTQCIVPAAAKSGVTAIAAGSGHSLAVKNGVVLAWGCDVGEDYGQCTVPAAAKSGVTAIAAGDFHSLALKNGQVIAWGCPTAPLNYDWGQCTVPTAAQSGVTAIAAGDTFSLALRGGRVYSWGSGCNVPNSALSGVVAIAAGGSSAHCLAIKSDGTVIAWGNNEWGQIDVPAELKNAATSHVVAIATGYGHSVAVKNDGTVVAWADDYAGRIDVPAGLTGVTAVTASWHNLVIVPAPRVTINQAAGQADPATTTPIQFTATFTRPVTNFTAADVTLSGTANRTNATITVSGGPSVYTISVNGVSSSGTVIATIAAGVATDAVGVPNLASTSTDNSVTFTSDTTAPVANPTQSPVAAPSGWNNTNVTVTWNWTDPTTPGPTTGIDPANCTTSSVSSGSGTINLSATCKDLAGNVGTATYQVRVDPTAPTANPSQSPAANAAGWNNTDVTVNWNWVSTGAIIDTANCTTSSTSSGEGTLTLSATCKDVANNQRTVPYTVKVDKTAPVVAVIGVNNGATYTAGNVPTAGCSTTDPRSGVATQATISVTGGNPDGSGAFTATCSGATDLAGNSAAPSSVSYTVNALINISVTQQSVSAVYNATPQNCPSAGGSLPFHTVIPTLRSTAAASFTNLFFRVRTLEYTTAQGGQQPVLCNASSGNGGAGSTLAIANSSLPGGNSQFEPGEDLLPTFQIGLPVRTQYRFFVDLYAVSATAASEGAAQEGEYLGSFAYTFDVPLASGSTELFLPLITR